MRVAEGDASGAGLGVQVLQGDLFVADDGDDLARRRIVAARPVAGQQQRSRRGRCAGGGEGQLFSAFGAAARAEAATPPARGRIDFRNGHAIFGFG